MDNIFIEKISKTSQIEVVAELAYGIWNEYFTPIIGQSQVDYMLQKFQSKKAIEEQINQGFIYFLINNSKGHVGYMGVYPENNQLLLSKLYIRLAERNKSYGRKAVDFLEKLARERELSKISLTVNKDNFDSIKAYENFGFITVKAAVKDIGNHFVMDDYIMEKNITL